MISAGARDPMQAVAEGLDVEVGVEIPNTTKAVIALSENFPWSSVALIPAEMPNIQVRKETDSASLQVLGKTSARMSATGRF